MKKYYLRDLKNRKDYKELFKKILQNNDKFNQLVFENYYQMMMDCQLDDDNNILGNNHPGINIKDNYSSFYLVLTDWTQFIDNVDSIYLSDEDQTLYKYIINKKETLYNMDCYSENYSRLEDHIEKKCKILLQHIENYLHEYEKIDEDDLIEWESEDVNMYYDDYYITSLKDCKLFEDVKYRREF